MRKRKFTKKFKALLVLIALVCFVPSILDSLSSGTEVCELIDVIDRSSVTVIENEPRTLEESLDRTCTLSYVECEGN